MVIRILQECYSINCPEYEIASRFDSRWARRIIEESKFSKGIVLIDTFFEFFIDEYADIPSLNEEKERCLIILCKYSLFWGGGTCEHPRYYLLYMIIFKIRKYEMPFKSYSDSLPHFLRHRVIL